MPAAAAHRRRDEIEGIAGATSDSAQQTPESVLPDTLTMTDDI